MDLSGLVRDYGDVDAEWRAARKDAALFDFSFMSRARLAGAGAAAALNAFQPRPVERLAVGRIAYALRLAADGFVRTDLTVWRLAEDVFELYSGDHRDIDDLLAMAGDDVAVTDLSEHAVFAVQGPSTPARMHALCGDALDGLDYFGFRAIEVHGLPVLAGRLGYTGEKGVELIVDADHAAVLWQHLADRLPPAGFAAIDRLRIEAGFVLFANECRLPVRPADLGLGGFADDPAPPRWRLTGFRAAQALPAEPWRPPGPPRPPRAGEIAVTSACRHGDGVIGLGFVDAGSAAARLHDPVTFGEVVAASIPFLDPEKRRPRGPWRAEPGPGSAG